MSVEELSPIVQELTRNPVAFMGGFVAGLLRLNLSDDPVKTWLSQQGVKPETAADGRSNPSATGKGPQSITID